MIERERICMCLLYIYICMYAWERMEIIIFKDDGNDAKYDTLNNSFLEIGFLGLRQFFTNFSRIKKSS